MIKRVLTFTGRSPLAYIYNKYTPFAKKYLWSITFAMICGFCAHMFAFTNKLINADETIALFSKGSTVSSGRWALELIRCVLPDYSMPFLWGALSIFLISLAACITLEIFHIRNKASKLLLPAMFVVFPSLTSTLCFMFTSSAYALSFIMAVASVLIFVYYKNRKWAWFLSCCVLTFSIGIYQAYIALAAGYFILLMIQRLLNGQNALKVFVFGLQCVAMLLVSLILYYAIAVLFVGLYDEPFLSYAVEKDSSILFRVALAYNGFVRSFTDGYYGFVNSTLSKICHYISLVIGVVLFFSFLRKLKNCWAAALALLCLSLMPLAINCFFLISNTDIIHSIVLYSFVCVYVLAAILLEHRETTVSLLARDLVFICMFVTILNNVFFANKVYLKMYMQYENAYSFFNSIITQVYMTEGYDTSKSLAIIGEYDNVVYNEEFDLGHFFGPSENLINIYTKDGFIANYIGYNGKICTAYEKGDLCNTSEYISMPVYPNNGSIKIIGDSIVVKLS